MPNFLEQRLRQEAAAKGFTGRHADAYVYGALNNLGAMRGNQETAKGRQMDAKHAQDVKAGKAAPAPSRPAKPVVPHPHKNLGPYLHPPKKGR